MSPILKAVAAVRMAVGASTLVIPRSLGPLFGLPVVPDATILARIFGARDFAIGLYQWRAVQGWEAAKAAESGGAAREPLIGSDDVPAAGHQVGKALGGTAVDRVVVAERERELTTMLSLGLLCDAVDVLSLAACAAEGNISELGLATLGAGALTFAAVQTLYLMKFRKAAKAPL